MDAKEQAAFLEEMSRNVVREMVCQIQRGDVPESWDGNELRQWLKDRFGMVVIGQMENHRCSRYKDYRNTVLVNNLL
jgi:hypothetical protein